MNKKVSQFITPQALFFLHGLITLAAGVVLIVDPNLIPGIVGIHLSSSEYLVPYLLGTAELCIATISLGASRLVDELALRTVAWSFVVLHGSTALIEIYAYTQGLDAIIWGNIALRVVVAALFVYFGMYPSPRKTRNKA